MIFTSLCRSRTRYLTCRTHLCLLHTQSKNKRNTIIILTGATATGKSSAAEFLCTKYDHYHINNYEIVVADSVQAMRHLNIGSNKPSADVLSTIPHHMIDIHEPGELYSAGEYCREATRVITDIVQRGKVPLVVGGNTMWIDWLIKGTPNAPKSSSAVKHRAALLLAPFTTPVPTTTGNTSSSATAADEVDTIQADVSGTPSATSPCLWTCAVGEVEKRKNAIMEAGGLSVDEESSVQMTVAANDWYRLHRLLEIVLTYEDRSEAMNSSQQLDECSSRAQFRGLVAELTESTGADVDLRCFFLGGERMELYRSIDERCVAMLQGGLLEEVATLWTRKHVFQLPQHSSGFGHMAALSGHSAGVPPCPTASAAIGYRQTVNFLCGATPQGQKERPKDRERARKKYRERKELVEYVDQFATATRNYAKRQLHWYRKDPNFLWIHDTGGTGSGASERIAKELYYWVYESPRDCFESVLNQQFVAATEFAVSDEMKQLRNASHLLKAKFNKIKGRSGDSFILRSCEGALDKAALKRYTSHTKLTKQQVDELCVTADSCRAMMSSSGREDC